MSEWKIFVSNKTHMQCFHLSESCVVWCACIALVSTCVCVCVCVLIAARGENILRNEHKLKHTQLVVPMNTTTT